jgi:hypothetical protein
VSAAVSEDSLLERVIAAAEQCQLSVLRELTSAWTAADARPPESLPLSFFSYRGCKPKPPKFPSGTFLDLIGSDQALIS